MMGGHWVFCILFCFVLFVLCVFFAATAAVVVCSCYVICLRCLDIELGVLFVRGRISGLHPWAAVPY